MPATIAAIVLLTLTVAPAGTAYADPPPWAPAPGWRAKHDDGRRHRHHRARDRPEVYVHHYYDSGPAAYREPIIVGQGSPDGVDRSSPTCNTTRHVESAPCRERMGPY